MGKLLVSRIQVIKTMMTSLEELYHQHRNFGVGTGAVVNIAQTPRDLHLTLTSNHFTRFDAVTPYGSHNNQRLSYSTNINIMGTTARTNAIDEDNILISTLGTGSGNATRVNAGSTGDNPTPVYTSWTARTLLLLPMKQL